MATSMIPKSAQEQNLQGVIAHVSSAEWLDGFMRGIEAQHKWRNLPPMKKKCAGPGTKTTFYLSRKGGNIILGMYYPKTKTLFYLGR